MIPFRISAQELIIFPGMYHKIKKSHFLLHLFYGIINNVPAIPDCVMFENEVLTTALMNVTVFWDVTPCSLIEVYRRFGGACCFLHDGDD
jgi:hypothetical protein